MWTQRKVISKWLWCIRILLEDFPKMGGIVHWVKINSAWKLVNKSQNKGRKDGSLDIDHGQTSVSREIFSSWELLQTLRSSCGKRGEAGTLSISVDDRKIGLTARWMAGVWQIPLCGTKQSFQIHLWLETNFRLPLIKCRYGSSLGSVSSIRLVMCCCADEPTDCGVREAFGTRCRSP